MTDFTRVQLEVVKRVKPVGLAGLAALLDEWGLARSPQEQLWVITLDSLNQVRTVTPVAIGTYHDSFVAIPTILAPVFLAASDRFIVAHNHPAGRTTPSANDLDLTARIKAAADICDLMFDDHLIVEPRGSWSSMASLGHLRAA
jgi:DNA repair protein RadC